MRSELASPVTRWGCLASSTREPLKCKAFSEGDHPFLGGQIERAAARARLPSDPLQKPALPAASGLLSLGLTSHTIKMQLFTGQIVMVRSPKKKDSQWCAYQGRLNVLFTIGSFGWQILLCTSLFTLVLGDSIVLYERE